MGEGARGGASSGTAAASGGGQENEAGGEGGSTSAGSAAGGSAASTSSAGSGLYLRCESEADCAAYGGGKVCCAAGAMHFCTKPSACSGDTLP